MMSDKIILTLHTLPIELIYRILDNLTDFTILYSMRNVCQRMNAIVDSYHRYQVILFQTTYYTTQHSLIISYRHSLY